MAMGMLILPGDIGNTGMIADWRMQRQGWEEESVKKMKGDIGLTILE